MDKFSARLKELRKKMGISQEALGEKLGIGQTSIANYETNKRIPSLEVFIGIAEIFNVSLDYLAGSIENEENKVTRDETHISIEGKAYLELLLKGNKGGCINYILNLNKNGWTAQEIYEEIFVPVMKKTGDLWEKGEVSVGEEHFISNVTLEIISQLHSGAMGSINYKEKILMSTVEEEDHKIALKIMENILSEKGYKTYFLGNKTSSRHLVDSIKQQDVKIVVLSITMKSLVSNLEKTIHMIREEISVHKTKIIVAGQGIINEHDMIYRFGADAYGKSFNDVLSIIEKWTTG